MATKPSTQPDAAAFTVSMPADTFEKMSENEQKLAALHSWLNLRKLDSEILTTQKNVKRILCDKIYFNIVRLEKRQLQSNHYCIEVLGIILLCILPRYFLNCKNRNIVSPSQLSIVTGTWGQIQLFLNFLVIHCGWSWMGLKSQKA